MKTLSPVSFAALLYASTLLSACDPTNSEPSAANTAPAPRAVKVVHPHKGEAHRFLTLPAEVHPLYQVTLYTKVAGYLDALTVDKGDSVKKGDLIANIDVPELQVEKIKYDAELQLALANLQLLEGTHPKEGTAGADDAELNLAVARAKVNVAKANVNNTETMLNYARITAPFDGIVTKRYVDPGAFIPAPNAADTPEAAAIVNLTDFATLRIQIPVPETEVPHIVIGQAVTMTTDDLPGKRFEGKVTRFYHALDRHTKTMLTEVQMPNPNLELRPGMLMSARIDIEQKNNVLLLPASALVKEKTNTFVFTTVNAKAKKVLVKVGFSDGPEVEIVSGVAQGDQVLAAQQGLQDGVAVVVDGAN
jgi:RND family efflux transporter MFP subunit